MASVDYDSALNDTRTNAVQTETGGDFRVSYESRDDLYFIRSESGPVKIGRGRDPKKRLTQCRTGSHEELTLLGTVPGRGYEEKVWHAAFQDNRLRGEWFNWDDDLEEAIRCALKGDDWWHHLLPPQGFDWIGETEDDLEEGVVDWHIAICMALMALRDGNKPPLNDANELAEFGECMMLAGLNIMATEAAKLAI